MVCPQITQITQIDYADYADSRRLKTIFIQLGPNNPEIMLRTNIFRGIDRFDTDPEEIWGSFFTTGRSIRSSTLLEISRITRNRP